MGGKQSGDDDGYPMPEEMRENNPNVRFGFSSGARYHNSAESQMASRCLDE